MFPDYNWLIWKFNKMGNNVWEDKKIQKDYLIWLGKKLGYTTMEDWYKINQKDIYNNLGGGLLVNYYNGSPSKFVMTMFPYYNWNISKFSHNKTETLIEEFLSNNESNFDIKKLIPQFKREWCKNTDTGMMLPYDFYIESLDGTKIIIECDGEYHYSEISHFYRNGKTLKKTQDRDIFKMNKALENNINIIRVHQGECGRRIE